MSYLSQTGKRKNENSPYQWQFHRCNFPHHSGSQGKYEEQGPCQVNISTSSSHCSLTLSRCDHFYRPKSRKCWILSPMSPLPNTFWRWKHKSTQPHRQPPHSQCYKLHKKTKTKTRQRERKKWKKKKKSKVKNDVTAFIKA